MKKIFSIVSATVVLAVVLMGCYRDVIPPPAPDAPPQKVSFNQDVIPIFNASCNMSGCHDAVPTKQPALSPDKAYSALVNGGYVNLLVPENSRIYMSVKSNSMPVGGSITSEEKQIILDWIRTGARNN